MRKSRKIILIAVVAIGIATLGWVVLRPREPEPFYQGKPLSFWLKQYYPNLITIGGTELKRDEAEQAIRHIGTNAIPTLLRMLREKDSPLGLKISSFLQRQRIVRINYITARSRNFEAALGFEILGNDASNAVPALIKIFEDNISPYSQMEAGFALIGTGPAARQAIPSLLLAATNSVLETRAAAIVALSRIPADPALVVPVLMKCAQDTNAFVRRVAIDGLRRYGSPAIGSLNPLPDDKGKKAKEDTATEVK